MTTFALIPVKDPAKAKTRLSSHLSREERKELVSCMLEDVLGALRGLVEPVIIGDRDPGIEGAHFLKEGNREGLSRAVKKGASYAIEQGARATLFVPADTPLIERRHVEDILSLGRDYRLVISPARKGGVSLIYKRPPDLMEERFSSHSFPDIIAQAGRKKINYHIYDSFFLSLDIDTWEDIQEFLHYGKGTITYRCLERLREG